MPLTLTQVKQSLSSNLLIFQGGIEPFFSDRVLKQFLEEAVEEYQKIIPYYQKTAITLVPGESEYDWPDDAIDVMKTAFGTAASGNVFYGPSSTGIYFDAYWNVFSDSSYQSPANVTRDSIFRAFNSGQRNGTIDVDYSLRKIVISPTPTEALDLYVVYAENYPRVDDQKEITYADILDIHFRPIVFLVQSMCYNALADATMMKASKVGNRDYRSENKATFFQKKSEMLKQKFSKGFGISAVGRT